MDVTESGTRSCWVKAEICRNCSVKARVSAFRSITVLSLPLEIEAVSTMVGFANDCSCLKFKFKVEADSDVVQIAFRSERASRRVLGWEPKERRSNSVRN